MTLRVTQSMLSSQMLSYINSNYQRMSNDQTQLATGRKINQPADDPVGITYALRYRSELSINDQYETNLNDAQSNLSHTDTVMSQLNDVVQRVQDLTVQGATGTNPQTALDAINKELGTLNDQALSIGNDQFNGKYTFNGQMTDKKPYTTGTEATDDGSINVQFAAGVTMATNITGNEVFGNPSDSDNLFTIIKGLQSAFSSGNISAAQSFLPQLTSRANKISDMQAEVGAKENRLTLLDNRLQDMNTNLTTLDSQTEDADMAKVITDFQSHQNVYQASLSAGAKIIQPSLLDYLK